MQQQKTIPIITVHPNMALVFPRKFSFVMEEWFSEINKTDSNNFPTAKINREIIRINQDINFPCVIKHLIHTTEINNGCNIHIFQIMHEKCYGSFHLSGNQISLLTQQKELSHKSMGKNWSIKIHHLCNTVWWVWRRPIWSSSKKSHRETITCYS